MTKMGIQLTAEVVDGTYHVHIFLNLINIVYNSMKSKTEIYVIDIQ